CKSRN
ncbi:putative 5'-3' exonuclease, partial [Vibrio parahaemolyticus V-223/04]